MEKEVAAEAEEKKENFFSFLFLRERERRRETKKIVFARKNKHAKSFLHLKIFFFGNLSLSVFCRSEKKVLMKNIKNLKIYYFVEKKNHNFKSFLSFSF